MAAATQIAPHTAERNSASRFNALQHGLDPESILLPGEDRDAYERMVADYCAEFHPQSPLEEAHLATIIHSDWLRRRLRRTQGKLYRALLAEGSNAEDLDIALLNGSPNAKLLRRVTAEIASLERSYFRALNDLRRLCRANRDRRDAETDLLISTCSVADIEAELISLRQSPASRASAASAPTPLPNLASIPSPGARSALRL